MKQYSNQKNNISEENKAVFNLAVSRLEKQGIEIGDICTKILQKCANNNLYLSTAAPLIFDKKIEYGYEPYNKIQNQYKDANHDSKLFVVAFDELSRLLVNDYKELKEEYKTIEFCKFNLSCFDTHDNLWGIYSYDFERDDQILSRLCLFDSKARDVLGNPVSNENHYEFWGIPPLELLNKVLRYRKEHDR